MAEPTPPLAADRPGEPLVYRPLSGPAVVGLACAALYAAIVAVSVVVGLFKREPMFLANGLLVLPAAGAALGVLALRQIRNSEETRAGGALARWAVWLSVLAGFGYATYALFTGLAIKQQADDFLRVKKGDSGFFELLKEGNVEAAFLLTKPPSVRRLADAHNLKALEAQFDAPVEKESPKGPLTAFRQAGFVQILTQPSNPPTRIEPLGVKDWGYVGKGYKVVRRYRITTAEGVFEMLVPVQSMDSVVPGEGRKWMVLWGLGMEAAPQSFTAFGEKMHALRSLAQQFANAWLGKLYSGKVFAAYLDTRAPAERGRLVELFASQHVLPAALAAGAAPPGGGLALLPTGAAAAALHLRLHGLGDFLTDNKVFVVDALHSADSKFTDRARRAAAEVFTSRRLLVQNPSNPREVGVGLDATRAAHWEVREGQLWMTLRHEWRVRLPGAAAPPAAILAWKLVLAADENLDPSTPGAERLWRVVRLEFDRAVPDRGFPSGPP